MASESGRPVGSWTPVELGVHPVIGGGPMPAYVRRPHDKTLRVVLDPAAADSRLVVLRGGPATGKTRAAYEAVTDLLADWRLEYPVTAAALAARLEAGIPARTVLWLGGLRHYADADDGAAVLDRLGDLLEEDGYLVITTIWPEHWDFYAAAAHAGLGAGDPARVAGRLLDPLEELALYQTDDIDPARGGVIDIPAGFTAAEMDSAAGAGDPVLAAAAAAAADGQVTQYLAGAGELLRRYDGPGADPHGQAVIAAAMDAARLGHARPLPAVLLLDAAAGYLTGAQHGARGEGWGDAALAWATDGAVQALRPVPGGAGDGGYRIAGYLDRHGRRTRQDRLGPASLWDALAAHAAGACDQSRLAQAARDRGLYRHAAALWTAAAAAGSTGAARHLVTHLRQVSRADAARAARWAVGRADLKDPWEVARLLEALREAEAGDAVEALLARLLTALHAAGAEDAAGGLAGRAVEVSLDQPEYVAWLLRTLHAAGAGDAVRTLASRAAEQVSLEDMSDVAALLGALHAAGAGDAVRTLASRAADGVGIDDPQQVAWLLEALHAAGAEEAVTALLARDPAGHADADQAWEAAELVAALHQAGAGDAAAAMAARAAEQAEITWPDSTARLLAELRAAGAGDAVRALLARDPAGQADLFFAYDVTLLLAALRSAGADDAVRALATRIGDDASAYDPGDVGVLLAALRDAGAGDAVRALASRALDHASLDDPEDVASRLGALRAAGADEAIRALLARDPAGQARLDDPWQVGLLVAALRAAGASAAAGTLASRAADRGSVDDEQGAARLLAELRAAGAGEAARTLAGRAAGQASLEDPLGVARLLEGLRDAGADEAARVLLARDPAGQVPVRAGDAARLARLLAALRAAGAEDAVRALASRAADAGLFGLFLETYPGEAPGYRFGREPDGAPSPSWSWHEPTRSGAAGK